MDEITVPAPGAEWQVFPARHSIELMRQAHQEDERDAGPDDGSAPRLAHGAYLQTNDHGLEGLSEPALSLLVSDEELRELRDPRLAAATHYGPAVQEKASNEDFALSAVIRTCSGREFAMAAVADGVSSRTFWSARTARIACLGVYKALRQCVSAGIDPGDEETHQQLAKQVAATIDAALIRDGVALEAHGSVPMGWDPFIYDKHKRDAAAWYRSTLLFGVVGDKGGMIGITGDGGVRGLLVDDSDQNEPIELRVMFAEAGRDLTSYVSRGFSHSDIRVLPLRSSERLATHVIFATDGLDLTMQQFAPNEVEEEGRRCHSRYRDLPLDDAASAAEFLEIISKEPGTALDNLSVARLTWPLPDAGKRWASWPSVPPASWRRVGEPDQISGVLQDERGAVGDHDNKIGGVVSPSTWIIPAALAFILGSLTTLAVMSVVPWRSVKPTPSGSSTASSGRPVIVAPAHLDGVAGPSVTGTVRAGLGAHRLRFNRARRPDGPLP